VKTGPTSKAAEPGQAPRVEVACAFPDRQRVVTLPLPDAGLTAGQAVSASGLLDAFPELSAQPLVVGIYGEVCEPDRLLRDGDRVEIYRPLRHDPRALRRERAATRKKSGAGRR
jgi:uncharacterized protein